MSFVIDVETHNFDQAVLARSQQVPVLVDFWAAWCGPCRTLGPILEKLASELSGAFLLAKVDTEQSPDLAARYGVRGIPDVKLFVRGEQVAGFTGAQPEAMVRRFLEQHLPSELDERVRQAESWLEAGKAQDAERALQDVVAQKKNHAHARLLLAGMALERGDDAALAAHVGAMPPGREADQGAAMLELSALGRTARAHGDIASVQAAAQQQPESAELSYALGAHLAAQGRQREALEQLVSTLSLRGAPREDVRRAMVALFTLLGPQDPLTQEYRRRLQIML
jgi:putative thioredoxin